MVKNLQVYIFGDILSDDKKKLLIDWMSDNSITDTLIKAETPQGWKVIDKSGSGDYGARNDISAQSQTHCHGDNVAPHGKKCKI